MRKAPVAALAAVLVASALCRTADAALLKVYALGETAVPTSINKSGVVVGYDTAGGAKPVTFGVLAGGSNVNLNSGTFGAARGINDAGLIVGYETINQDDTAWLFDGSGNGNNTNLGADKRAYAVSNSNRAVGGSGNGEAVSAWFWDLNTPANPIPLGQGEAVALNDNGAVVGYGHHGGTGNNVRATLFDATGNGNNINLGKLNATDGRSFAEGVNNAGQIVGASGDPANGYTATLYDSTGNGNNVAIGAAKNSFARGVNNSGQAVGEENSRAALFDASGVNGTVDLNSLIHPAQGWVLWNAYAINDLGWIVGVGNKGGFVLAPADAYPNYVDPPVPEPSTLALSGMAAAWGAGVWRRRREG